MRTCSNEQRSWACTCTPDQWLDLTKGRAIQKPYPDISQDDVYLCLVIVDYHVYHCVILTSSDLDGYCSLFKQERINDLSVYVAPRLDVLPFTEAPLF